MPRPKRHLRTAMSRASSPPWTEEATGELLAWAEYCRRSDGHGKQFERTIVHHLQESIGIKFSYSQIDNTIKELAKSSTSPLASISYDNLYKTWGMEGMIKCVIKDRTARKIFQCRVNELHNNVSSKPTTPRATFIQSRMSTDPIVRKTGNISSAKQVGRTRKQRANRRRYESKRKQLLKSVAAPEIPPTPSSSCEDVPSTPEPLLSREKIMFNDSQESPATAGSRGTDPLVRDIRSTSITAHFPRGEERVSLKPLSSRASQPCSKHECEDQKMNLHHDNAHLREQLRTMEEKIAELEIQLQSKETASSILGREDVKSAHDHVARTEQEIGILNTKIYKKDTLVSSIKTMNKQWSVSNLMDLQDHMDRIHCTLEDVLQEFPDGAVEVQRLMITAHPDLQTLCHRIFGVQAGRELTVSCSYLIRSLVSAAVCEWVFECELRETYTISSHLMEIMLSQIARLNGENVVKLLHFSANDELLHGNDFQDVVIPRRARILATRIRELLRPCLSAWCPSDCKAKDVEEQWQQEDEHLTDIFVHALKVKAHTLVSNEIFEVIYPASSTRVDIQNVQIEELATSTPRRKSASRTCIVQLPLAPGLRSHPHEPRRKLVDYNSFRKPGDDLKGNYTMIKCPLVLASTY